MAATQEWGIPTHVLGTPGVECKGARKKGSFKHQPTLEQQQQEYSLPLPTKPATQITCTEDQQWLRFHLLEAASHATVPGSWTCLPSQISPHSPQWHRERTLLLESASKSEMSSDGSAWQWRVKIRNRPLFRFNDVGLRNRGLSASSHHPKAISRLWAPGGCIWDTSNCRAR